MPYVAAMTFYCIFLLNIAPFVKGNRPYVLSPIKSWCYLQKTIHHPINVSDIIMQNAADLIKGDKLPNYAP